MKNCLFTAIVLSLITFGCNNDEFKGKNSLVNLVAEEPSENCSAGGFKIQSGIDQNENSVLEENEIQTTEYICNGIDGNNGLDGSNSLLNIIPEAVGNNCLSGGYKIISGIDLNGNNLLDENEIQNTEYICNGIDGSNGLNGSNSLINVMPESPGDNCLSGGYKIIGGIDINNDNILNENEIQNIDYVCNGNDGDYFADRLVRLTVHEERIGITNTDWINPKFPKYYIPDFDKRDFENVDSIIFVSALITHTPNNTVSLELYNMTDNSPISNSLLKTDKTNDSFYYSKNIFDQLPSKKINIGIRLKNDKENAESSAKISYLYIYRH